jgi:Skp family chaperone for outer membrane proteins
MPTELHGLMIPPPKLPAKLEIAAEWMQERDKLVSQAAGIQAVATQAEFTGAEILLKLITAVSNDAEKVRKKLSDPFAKAAKDIKAMADGAREPLEAQKERLKGIMATYLREVQRRQQEEMERQAREDEERRRAEMERIERERQAEIAAAEADSNPFAAAEADAKFAAQAEEVASAPAEIAPETADTRKTMTTARTVWRFEIEDATAVPREFCVPDERKIREHVQRNKEASGIPGVRVWEELAVQAR